MRVTFRRNVSYVTCKGLTWTERTCHRVMGRPSCSLKCVEVFEASMLAFQCGEVWSAEFQHTLWRLWCDPERRPRSIAAGQALNACAQVLTLPGLHFVPWSCVFCVYFGCYRICLCFCVRRILEDHPCLEILSVFFPGQRLNYILNRPRHFREYYCSDGDSVRSAIVLTSYSAALLLVLSAVR